MSNIDRLITFYFVLLFAAAIINNIQDSVFILVIHISILLYALYTKGYYMGLFNKKKGEDK